MSSASELLPVVFTDADNTLWDTDGLFAGAQLDLLTAVEGRVGAFVKENRLDYVRRIDQLLAEGHHQGLRYPVRLLAIGLVHALNGDTAEKATQRAWREVGLPRGIEEARLIDIEQQFVASVRAMPSALPGVVEGLRRLEQAKARVYVVSEGDKARITGRLEHIGAVALVRNIVEAPKSVELFRRMSRLAGPINRSWMIGDQLSRDIQPAQEAGLRTVYIPSRFRPTWELASSQIEPDYTVATFDEAVSRILD